jgi:glycosyltransferase involved in cell wall biosynthesis
MMAWAYRSCDAIVNLGPRMHERLAQYASEPLCETVVPWALAEGAGRVQRPDPAVRARLFGDAQLALLYSGTLGRAHDFEVFVHLARRARERHGGRFRFAFAARGQRFDDLRRAMRADDTNIALADFGDEADLTQRLEAADIHLLSLRREWSGIVVPSKFFGSLAVGRPVLYAGPEDSDIAQCIDSLRVGWRVDPTSVDATLDALEAVAAFPEKLDAIQARAHAAYAAHFRREAAIDRWDALLRRLVNHRAPGVLCQTEGQGARASSTGADDAARTGTAREPSSIATEAGSKAPTR